MASAALLFRRWLSGVPIIFGPIVAASAIAIAIGIRGYASAFNHPTPSR
jgi:hypothetical protein